MNIYDAIKILGITDLEEISQEDVKKAYRKASKKYHPDCNPSGDEMMKLVNEAHSVLEEARYPITVNSTDNYDYGSEINSALNAINNLQGLFVEVCGAWVWVGGETKIHKDILKSQGFLFSGNKKMWYFRPKSKKHFFKGKSEYSIDEIRSKYGSQKVENKDKHHYALKAHV